MEEEGKEEGLATEPLIVSYNGNGVQSRKSSAITSSLVLRITVAASASFTCGYSGSSQWSDPNMIHLPLFPSAFTLCL